MNKMLLSLIAVIVCVWLPLACFAFLHTDSLTAKLLGLAGSFIIAIIGMIIVAAIVWKIDFGTYNLLKYPE